MRIRSLALAVLLSACSASPPVRTGGSGSEPAPAAAPTQLRVDHAWVKDAGKPAAQAAHRKAIEALRVKVMAGASFNAAWQSLGVDGDPWHVGEGETYGLDVLPNSIHDLPVGAVSPVTAGDGGLHLFRILARE